MRYRSLDGLRGVAAATVVLHHGLYSFPDFWAARPAIPSDGRPDIFSILRYTPLSAIVNGGGAVLIFFVLSGFVLTLALASPKRASYGVFITSRFLRIYPGFLVAILSSAVLFLLVGHTASAALSDWLKESTWSAPVTLPLIAGHLAMLDTPRMISLDNVIWSLAVEIRLSIIMPLIYFSCRRWAAPAMLIAILIAAVGMAIEPRLPELSASWARTAQYIPLFAAGSLLAIHRDILSARIASLSPGAIAASLLIVLLFYTFPSKTLRLPLAGSASIAIVLLALAHPVFVRCLSYPVTQHLGRISYSLYLVHLPILAAFCYGFADRMPVWAIMLIAIPVALVAANIFYRLVERPSHHLARSLSAWIDARVRKAEPEAKPITADSN